MFSTKMIKNLEATCIKRLRDTTYMIASNFICRSPDNYYLNDRFNSLLILAFEYPSLFFSHKNKKNKRREEEEKNSGSNSKAWTDLIELILNHVLKETERLIAGLKIH